MQEKYLLIQKKNVFFNPVQCYFAFLLYDVMNLHLYYRRYQYFLEFFSFTQCNYLRSNQMTDLFINLIINSLLIYLIPFFNLSFYKFNLAINLYQNNFLNSYEKTLFLRNLILRFKMGCRKNYFVKFYSYFYCFYFMKNFYLFIQLSWKIKS